jgi:hypothetical protein
MTMHTSMGNAVMGDFAMVHAGRTRLSLPPDAVVEDIYQPPAKDNPRARHFRTPRRPAREQPAEDAPAPLASPHRIDAAEVAACLIEMVRVIDRLPVAKGPAGTRSPWPAINTRNNTAPRRSMTVNEWAEALRDVQSIEAGRDQTKWAFARRPVPPRAAEISHAYETMAWPARFLAGREELARMLQVWVLVKARGRGDGADDMKRLCRKHGWKYSTFRRKRMAALQAIADGLNAAGERVK